MGQINIEKPSNGTSTPIDSQLKERIAKRYSLEELANATVSGSNGPF
ncbi:hypothetical protein [Neorhizobium sp. NCHU2750]|nr:hypothetical protein NCHU2750_58890 [Neorhizobium sp. NCHU2750]